MHEIRRIGLWSELPFIRLLDVVLITLLFRKVDCVFFGFEGEMGALLVVSGGGPSHQRVFPVAPAG